MGRTLHEQYLTLVSHTLERTNTHTDAVGRTPSVVHQIALVTLQISLVNTHTRIEYEPHLLQSGSRLYLMHTASPLDNACTNYKIIRSSADCPLKQKAWELHA